MCVKSWLGHFRIPKILNFQRQNLSCENEFYFHRKERQFSTQKPRSNLRFEQEAWENSEWAIFPDCFTLPPYALWLIEKKGCLCLKISTRSPYPLLNAVYFKEIKIAQFVVAVVVTKQLDSPIRMPLRNARVCKEVDCIATKKRRVHTIMPVLVSM